MIHIAFISNGKSTNRYHLPYLLERKELFNVKMIVDFHMDNIRWPRIDSITYTSRIEDVLEDCEIDLVVVTSKSEDHFKYAKLVLEAGKHCLVEKPFVATSLEAKYLFNLAKQKGLIIQAYQNRRFDSDYLTLKKVIQQNYLGKLLELEMHFDYHRPEIKDLQTDQKMTSSFLYGHGSHTIDQVIGLFGKPNQVHYDVRSLLNHSGYNDYFDIDLYYQDLKVSVKSSYYRIKPRPSFILYGEKGMFIKENKDRQELDLKRFYMPNHQDFGQDDIDDYGTLCFYQDGTYHEQKVVTIQGDYGRIYDGLYQTITNNAEKIVSDEETLQVIEILETGWTHFISK